MVMIVVVVVMVVMVVMCLYDKIECVSNRIQCEMQ